MKTKFLLFSLTILFSCGIAWSQTSYGNLSEGNAGTNGDVTNAYFGNEAGLINTGVNNTFIGNESGHSNTTGYENSGLGSLTLHSNTSGYRNTANGIYSLFNNTTGDENTGVGYAALGFNNTGIGNAAIGMRSLVNNSNGIYNTAIGYNALSANTTGDVNVAIGPDAGPDSGSTDLVNTVAIGFGALVFGSNEVRIGNGSITSIGGIVPWSVVSDGRFKKEIREDVPGLDFITGLRPVSYELDPSKFKQFSTIETDEELPQLAPEDNQRTIGFLAQEVDQLVKENGYIFSGVEQPQNEKDHYSIRYSEFVIPLVKGMQEQQQLIESQQQLIQVLQEKVEALENLVTNAEKATWPSDNSIQDKNIDVSGFALHQNSPNPFNKTTTISAVIPERVINAKIIIYNLQGLELERYTIPEKGKISVAISGGSLSSGMYIYALIADGQIIDTKKMILTR